MRVLQNLFLLFVLFGLQASCARYTTPVQNDPLYKFKPLEVKLLKEGGVAYEERVSDFEAKGEFKPKEGETYRHFQYRIYNTLLVQEHDKDKLAREVLDLEDNVESLEAQLTDMQASNIDLRLVLARVKSNVADASDVDSPMFSQYKIREGDTLQKIASKKFGTYTAWLTLFRFNENILKSGPNKLIPGTVILIPKVTNN